MPNNAFKPTPFRSANHMAGTACHMACSTARRGLTWVLGSRRGFPMRFIIAFSFAALLAACATTPTSVQDAAVVPSDRVYAPESTGDIYQIRITRDSGRRGSACTTRIYLNGNDAADLEPAETITLSVPAGRHIIGVSQSPTGGRLCTGFDEVARSRHEIEVTAETGEIRNYRLATSYGGFRLEPTAF